MLNRLFRPDLKAPNRLFIHRTVIYPCTHAGNPLEQCKLHSHKDFPSTPGKCLCCAWRCGAEMPALATEPAKVQPVQGNTASALKSLAHTSQVHVFRMQGWGTMPSLHHIATVQHRDGLSVGGRKCSPLESTACKEQTALLKYPSGQCLQCYYQDYTFSLLNSVCLQHPH